MNEKIFLFYVDKSNDYDWLVTLANVFLGFLLAIAWDNWKNYTAKKTDFSYSKRALIQEFKINTISLNKNLQILSFDNDLIQRNSGTEASASLERVVTGTGESILIKGTFDNSFPEYAEELRNLYAASSSLNAKISNRELFKATNGAMMNYHSRRSNINTDLVNHINSQIITIDELSKKLPEWNFFKFVR